MTEETPLTIEVDRTTGMFLTMLKETLAEEPEEPDLEKHVGSLLESVAHRHNQWERHVNALRLLSGIRLTNQALDQL